MSRSSSGTTTRRSRAADLGALRARTSTGGLLLDFDGTLSEIVLRPELARPLEGVRETLADLARRYRLVGILTGRRAEEVAALLRVPHLRFFGLYGLEGVETPELVTAAVPLAARAAAEVPGAWIEDKGASIAVHYRQAPDPVRARAALLVGLTPVAVSSGLELIEGKMVLELLPPGRPRKGGAIERLAGEHELDAVLYAGDDHADLEAFAALDRLRSSGALVVKVAVRGAETPVALLEAADVLVDGPAGLLDLLRDLA
jgi:trehalose 6-phosphate phosphatase